MLALPDTSRLAPRERHALGVLVDLAAVLPATGDAAGKAVRLVISETPAPEEGVLKAESPVPVPSTDGEVRLPLSWLRLAGALLACETDYTAERDKHGRPVSRAHRLVQAENERQPVVSLLARGLRNAVKAAAKHREVFFVDAWPEERKFAAALTHDLDVASLWPAFTALRMAELATKGDIARMAQVAGAAIANIASDPVRAGVLGVVEAEAAAKASSTWYIICGTPTLATMRAGDVTYDPESPRVRAIIDELWTRGHEIGLHGSFETAADGSHFATQRQRLDVMTIGNSLVAGVRQHFLKRTVGATERAMRAAGFTYDSTAGFPDRNGFRLGVADVVPLWDQERDEPVGLMELPFCWMDRAQSKYQGIEDPMAWIDDALELAARCEAVQGAWCGIWHPNLTPELGYPAAPAAYAHLVRSLAQRGAWLATSGDIVEWRRRRQALRAVGYGPLGGVTLEGANESVEFVNPPLIVRDAAGAVRGKLGGN